MGQGCRNARKGEDFGHVWLPVRVVRRLPFPPPHYGINICLPIHDLNSIGEESYTDGTRRSLTDAPTFCVDPIGILFKAETQRHFNHPHRRDYQLCAWLPFCVRLYRPLVQETARYRRHLQSVPRSTVLCPEGPRCIS